MNQFNKVVASFIIVLFVFQPLSNLAIAAGDDKGLPMDPALGPTRSPEGLHLPADTTNGGAMLTNSFVDSPISEVVLPDTLTNVIIETLEKNIKISFQMDESKALNASVFYGVKGTPEKDLIGDFSFVKRIAENQYEAYISKKYLDGNYQFVIKTKDANGNVTGISKRDEYTFSTLDEIGTVKSVADSVSTKIVTMPISENAELKPIEKPFIENFPAPTTSGSSNPLPAADETTESTGTSSATRGPRVGYSPNESADLGEAKAPADIEMGPEDILVSDIIDDSALVDIILTVVNGNSRTLKTPEDANLNVLVFPKGSSVLVPLKGRVTITHHEMPDRLSIHFDLDGKVSIDNTAIDVDYDRTLVYKLEDGNDFIGLKLHKPVFGSGEITVMAKSTLQGDKTGEGTDKYIIPTILDGGDVITYVRSHHHTEQSTEISDRTITKKDVDWVKKFLPAFTTIEGYSGFFLKKGHDKTDVQTSNSSGGDFHFDGKWWTGQAEFSKSQVIDKTNIPGVSSEHMVETEIVEDNTVFPSLFKIVERTTDTIKTSNETLEHTIYNKHESVTHLNFYSKQKELVTTNIVDRETTKSFVDWDDLDSNERETNTDITEKFLPDGFRTEYEKKETSTTKALDTDALLNDSFYYVGSFQESPEAINPVTNFKRSIHRGIDGKVGMIEFDATYKIVLDDEEIPIGMRLEFYPDPTTERYTIQKVVMPSSDAPSDFGDPVIIKKALDRWYEHLKALDPSEKGDYPTIDEYDGAVFSHHENSAQFYETSDSSQGSSVTAALELPSGSSNPLPAGVAAATAPEETASGAAIEGYRPPASSVLSVLLGDVVNVEEVLTVGTPSSKTPASAEGASLESDF